MKTIAYIKRRFYVSVFFLALMSMSFILMPFSQQLNDELEMIANIVISTMFWGCLILTSIFLMLSYKTFKRISKYVAVKEFLGANKLGIITFFSNPLAKIFDVSLIISILSMIIINIFKFHQTSLTYVIISALVLSFNMHCMFNGKIYKITKYKPKRRLDENANS